MRISGNRVWKGSFLAILKGLHKTHLHPKLPFTIISTANGLAIRSRTSQCKRILDAMVGHARLIPPQVIETHHTDGTTPKILAKLRQYVSVIKLSPRELFIAWGPLALVNHSCKASIEFEAGFGEGYTPKTGRTYPWGLRKLPSSKPSSCELAGNGKELLAFYRVCEGETDFKCTYCTSKEDRMKH